MGWASIHSCELGGLADKLYLSESMMKLFRSDGCSTRIRAALALWNPHLRGYYVLRVSLLSMLFVVWHAVAAQQLDIGKRRGSFTPGELALLPPFCRDIQGMPGYEGAAGDRWRAQVGDDFKHMHHYCRGLRDALLARTVVMPAKDRNFLWERAISEYQYMIGNCRPDMLLMPEIYTRMGEANLKLGRLTAAQLAFEHARKLKPDYWPAYSAWADQLVAVKLYDPARELLEQGLVHAPGNEELKRRLDKLGRQGLPVPQR